jgi:hypothetical protein
MGVKTLITDGFDEGGEWLDADDRALLIHTLQGLVEKYVARHDKAPKARMAEPADMTVLLLADGPPDFPRVWSRNDSRKALFGRDWDDEHRWQREGANDWYPWEYVLRVTKRGRLIKVLDGDDSL